MMLMTLFFKPTERIHRPEAEASGVLNVNFGPGEFFNVYQLFIVLSNGPAFHDVNPDRSPIIIPRCTYEILHYIFYIPRIPRELSISQSNPKRGSDRLIGAIATSSFLLARNTTVILEDCFATLPSKQHSSSTAKFATNAVRQQALGLQGTRRNVPNY